MNNELLNKYGSPLYVYDEKILRDRINTLKQFEINLKENIGVEVKLHYSTKSNGNPYILKVIKEMGILVDSMSPVELQLDKMAGFSNEDILYVCNNISQEEMAEVFDQGILICLDSISQLEVLGKVRPGSKVMIRINPGSFKVGHSEKVITSGENTKFGVCENNIKQLFEVASKYNIKIIGVHQHLGSLFLNDKIDEYISGVNAGLDIINRYFKDISIIDLGGGFGVPYKESEEVLDFDLLVQRLSPVLKDFINKYENKVEFKFEPGRYIPCESGYILGKVNAVKNENGKIWVGTDIGMNVIMRPTLNGSYHKIEIIKEDRENAKTVIANIVGNICESGDILGKDREILYPEVGDIVKIYNAGGYGYCMASSYTGRLKPAEVMINPDTKTEKLIRKRETFEDIASKFIDF